MSPEDCSVITALLLAALDGESHAAFVLSDFLKDRGKEKEGRRARFLLTAPDFMRKKLKDCRDYFASGTCSSNCPSCDVARTRAAHLQYILGELKEPCQSWDEYLEDKRRTEAEKSFKRENFGHDQGAEARLLSAWKQGVGGRGTEYLVAAFVFTHNGSSKHGEYAVSFDYNSYLIIDTNWRLL